jgi:hypothetical protein
MLIAKDILRRRLDWMETEGREVELRTNAEIRRTPRRPVNELTKNELYLRTDLCVLMLMDKDILKCRLDWSED